jgi:hypothetical protein
MNKINSVEKLSKIIYLANIYQKMKLFECEYCKKKFTRIGNLNDHYKRKNPCYDVDKVIIIKKQDDDNIQFINNKSTDNNNNNNNFLTDNDENNNNNSTEFLPNNELSDNSTEFLPNNELSDNSTEILPNNELSDNSTEILPNNEFSDTKITEFLPNNELSDTKITEFLPNNEAIDNSTKILPNNELSDTKNTEFLPNNEAIDNSTENHKSIKFDNSTKILQTPKRETNEERRLRLNTKLEPKQFNNFPEFYTIEKTKNTIRNKQDIKRVHFNPIHRKTIKNLSYRNKRIENKRLETAKKQEAIINANKDKLLTEIVEQKILLTKPDKNKNTPSENINMKQIKQNEQRRPRLSRRSYDNFLM